MLVININAVTDEGLGRPVNEDNFCINRHFKSKDSLKDKFKFKSTHNTLACVFDGIGGESDGETASFIASKTTARFDGFLPNDDWEIIVNEANARINDYAEKENCNLGCTAAMLYYRDGLVDICNLGDSRIYHFKNSKINKISKDHTELQRAVDMNLKDFNPEKSGINKNRLTKYLGIKTPSLSPYVVKNIEVSTEDLFIICSDGLTDMVSEEDISKIVNSNKFNELSTLLTKKAIENGGKDNVTVIAISFSERKSILEKLLRI